MLKLEKLTLADKSLYDKYIKATEYPANSWSGNFSYLWAHTNSKNLEIYKTLIDGMLVTIIATKKGRMYLPTLPFGKGDADKVLSVLEKCAKDVLSWNKLHRIENKALVNPINEAQLNFLLESPLFNTRLLESPLTGLERHFNVKKLTELKGKDFSQIRNKLNRFKKNYPASLIRPYKDTDFPYAIKLGKIWEAQSGSKYQRIIDGFYFQPFLKHHKELNHSIIIIELDGKLIGLASGEVLPTGEAWGALVKFDKNYDGISETLIIEMTKTLLKQNPGIKTINVGSDLGKAGLGFYKDRFRPIYRYKRYCLYYKE